MVYITAGIGCFLASLGFGILFHIRGFHLLYAGISGAIGGLAYYLVLNMGGNEMIAVYIASFLFSLYSEIMARACLSPVTTFVIPGLIPLVPGGGMYEMMVHAVEGHADLLIEKMLQTFSIAGALVLGIICASSLVQIYQIVRRKVLCVKSNY